MPKKRRITFHIRTRSDLYSADSDVYMYTTYMDATDIAVICLYLKLHGGTIACLAQLYQSGVTSHTRQTHLSAEKAQTIKLTQHTPAAGTLVALTTDKQSHVSF